MTHADPEERRAWLKEYMREYNKRPEVRARANAAKKEARRRRRQWWAVFKATLCCARCGESRPAALDFHHRDPTKKSFTLAQAIDHKGTRKLLEEIEKCEVICANCHRVEHAEQRSHTSIQPD